MNEVVASILWILGGLIALSVVIKRVPPCDRRDVWLCFWGHVASAFILILLTFNYFGHGDMQMYYMYGDALGDYIVDDPGRWGPEIIKLILQVDAHVPIEIYGHEGSSTTSITGITAFLMIINASSEYATGLAFSLLAFTGQLAMYAAFRQHFPMRYRRRLTIAILLVPSAVFWTSGVVKEAVAIAGMGWMIWGLHTWLVRNRRFSALMWILIGGVLVSISKAYILFPMTVAAGVWWFWRHSLSTRGTVSIARKPVHLVVAGLIAVVGMLGLGELLPQYSIDSLAEETAQMQYQGQRVEGGSSYAMGDPTQTSLLGQLAFTPLALVAALFRPFLFEAHNAAALINGLEMTVVAVLWIRILWLRGARGAWRLLRSSPALMFCVIFVVLFSLGVGLATTNLGTLSRYRVPMMPLYALILVMLYPLKNAPTPGPDSPPTRGASSPANRRR